MKKFIHGFLFVLSFAWAVPNGLTQVNSTLLNSTDENTLPAVTGIFALTTDLSIEIKEVGTKPRRFIVEAGPLRYQLPRGNYVQELSLAEGRAVVMLIFEERGPPGGAYYSSLLCIEASRIKGVTLKSAATAGRMEFIDYRQRWIDRLVNIEHFPEVVVEVCYMSQDKRDTKVYARLERWNVDLDEFVDLANEVRSEE